MFAALKNFFTPEAKEKYILKDVYGFFLPSSMNSDEKYEDLLMLLEEVFNDSRFTIFDADCEYYAESAIAIGVVVNTTDPRFGNFDLDDCDTDPTTSQIEDFNEAWAKIPNDLQELIKSLALNGFEASQAVVAVE